MDVVHERAAGIDISKRDAKVAVRVPGKRSGSYTTTVKTFGAPRHRSLHWSTTSSTSGSRRW
jgi:hypothetical protein